MLMIFGRTGDLVMYALRNITGQARIGERPGGSAVSRYFYTRISQYFQVIIYRAQYSIYPIVIIIAAGWHKVPGSASVSAKSQATRSSSPYAVGNRLERKCICS